MIMQKDYADSALSEDLNLKKNVNEKESIHV